jgi:hypothetical protein
MRKTFAIFLIPTLVIFVFIGMSGANPGKPNFMPSLYADGMVWGTKATTALPAPKGNNWHSFDKLFIIINGHQNQLPVGEAAPGNRTYNGGRWYTHTVMWTEAGLEAHGGNVPVLMSYEDIMTHWDLEHLEIIAGPPMGGPPPFFQCPLLPVKDS